MSPVFLDGRPMPRRDRGYDDRDTYSNTTDGAAASASYHALPDDDPMVPTAAELAEEEAAWRRNR